MLNMLEVTNNELHIFYNTNIKQSGTNHSFQNFPKNNMSSI